MQKRIIGFLVLILSAVLLMVSCAGNEASVSSETVETSTIANTAEETTDSSSVTIEITDTEELSISQEVTDKPVVTNIVTGEPVEIKVYEITITYVFSDGTKAAPSRKAQYEAGTFLHVESPEIEGYEPNLKCVEWSSISREKVFRVVYSPIGEETTSE